MRNLAASVHQRLLNAAKAQGRPFNEVLQYFALERFLYRLGRSSYRSQFVLKGAMMFAVWRSPFSRPTRDIDLLGRLDNAVEHVVSVVQAICTEPAPDDALRFDAESAVGRRLTEAADYEGVRVRVTAYLGTARIPVRIDVGFGDRVIPAPRLVQLPTILNLPPAEVLGYSPESAIAEKYHGMVYLGAINSRMKDFYDIWWLATRFNFDGADLARALGATFQRRRTALPAHPVAFSESFARDAEKQAQWVAFVRRSRLEDAPTTLDETVRVISTLLMPVAHALRAGEAFHERWATGGPWLPADSQESLPSGGS
jgi:hypothetical protein